MPRYFLHLRFRDGAGGLAVDQEQNELPNEGVLGERVLATARELTQTRMGAVRDWAEYTFEVTTGIRRLVLTLPFTEALP